MPQGASAVTVLANMGRRILTGRLLNAAPSAGQPGAAAPRYIAWGTGSTADAAVADTALTTEARSSATSGGNVIRVAGTDSQQTTSVTNDTYRVTGTVTADAGKTITEAALFDSDGAAVSPGPPTGGNIFIRGTFGTSGFIGLNTNDAISFTFNIQFT